ncbi:hypothetical protein AKG39_12970 [Acetobacterium bakii]|uniref:Uncharacterized protein n=1 Tax=Acetobacterium bakii TaxID=52689 RepID=A0A0L6TYQ8_9FIRM|nr:hypothetical protein AKG39_12970 [Acetobacterium bakii]
MLFGLGMLHKKLGVLDLYSLEKITFFFNESFPLDLLSYGFKIILFVVSLLLGLVIYYGILEKHNVFKFIHSFELSFNDICLSITLFLSLVHVYLKLTV